MGKSYSDFREMDEIRFFLRWGEWNNAEWITR